MDATPANVPKKEGYLKRRDSTNNVDGATDSTTKKCNPESYPGTPKLVCVTMRPQNSLQKTTLRAQFLSHEADEVESNSAERDNAFRTGSPLIASSKELSPVVIQPIKSHRSRRLRDVRQHQEVQQAIESRRNVVQLHKKIGRSFEDENFPRNAESILGSEEPSGSLTSGNYRWLRPHEMYVDEEEKDLAWTVFNHPCPSDIIPGPLRDCWLIGALSMLARCEHWLNQIVITDEYCVEGVYLVRLFDGGVWTTVLVDDFFPCDDRRRPIFSQAKRKQLWVPLIVKAVAKLHGNYKALFGEPTVENGLLRRGLVLLTGQPCDSIILTGLPSEEKGCDADAIWTELMYSREMKFLIYAECGARGTTKEEYDLLVGLQFNHGYSVLDVRSCDGHKLLKMWDPRDRTSWKGKWSVESSSWTDDLRLRLEPETQAPGIFWISFDDVLRYFREIVICRVRNSWHEVRFRCQPVLLNSANSTCFVLDINDQTEMEISLFQKIAKCKAAGNDDFNLGIFIFAKEPADRICRLVAFKITDTRDVMNLRTVLQGGEYFLISFFVNSVLSGETNPTKPEECAFAIHSSRAITIEELEPPEFFHTDMLISMSLCPEMATTLNSSKDGMIKFYEIRWKTVATVVAENNHPNSSVLVKCASKSSGSIESIRGKLQTADTVPPKHRQILTVVTIICNISHVISYDMVSGKPQKDPKIVQRRRSSIKEKTYSEKLHTPRAIA